MPHSQIALRCLKPILDTDCDGQARLARNVTRLFYISEEDHQGCNAFNEEYKPDFIKDPRTP